MYYALKLLKEAISKLLREAISESDSEEDEKLSPPPQKFQGRWTWISLWLLREGRSVRLPYMRAGLSALFVRELLALVAFSRGLTSMVRLSAREAVEILISLRPNQGSLLASDQKLNRQRREGSLALLGSATS